MSISKIDLLVEASKTEANQVLGFPLIVSIRKVESTTSKVMVSEEVLVLAKSRFEEGAKTWSHKEEFLKNLLSNSLEHLHERREQMAWSCVVLRVFQKKYFYRKTLVYEMSKIPLTLRDDRLHASIFPMACYFTGLKPKNKPKPVISLWGPLNLGSTNPVTFHSGE